MSFKERLLADLKEAMKSGDEIRKNTVQMARAAVLQKEKDDRIELTDEDIVDVIAKEVKKRKDALPEYEKSGRTDLIDNLKKEISILEKYLPEQLSDSELETIVKEVISSSGASSIRDMGKVMSEIMPKVKGRADGKRINEFVKKYLQ